MALRLMHPVAGGVVRLTHVFQFGFHMAQLGGLFFEIDLGFFDFAEKFFLLGFCFGLAQQPKQFLLFFLIALQFAKFICDRGLRL